MAASDHLNHKQLRMFMTARELRGMSSAEVDPTQLAGWRSHEQMWEDKRKDNADDGMATSVAKYGVEYPVTIGHQHGDEPKIDAGHHRIQAAYDYSPESYVPVKHTDYSRRQHREPPQPVTTNRFRSYP